MPTHQQIIWRMRGFVRRLRANKWRSSLGSAVVVGLVIAAALVTMLTFDWPLFGGDAASGQGSFIGGRPTVIDGDTVRGQGALSASLASIHQKPATARAVNPSARKPIARQPDCAS
jgi:hypothetical protein